MNDQIELCELANMRLNAIAEGLDKFGGDDLKALTQEQIVSAAVILFANLLSKPGGLNPLVILEIRQAIYTAILGTEAALIRRAEVELRELGIPEELIAPTIEKMRKGRG